MQKLRLFALFKKSYEVSKKHKQLFKIRKNYKSVFLAIFSTPTLQYIEFYPNTKKIQFYLLFISITVV